MTNANLHATHCAVLYRKVRAVLVDVSSRHGIKFHLSSCIMCKHLVGCSGQVEIVD
jgi:hypothetical protein